MEAQHLPPPNPRAIQVVADGEIRIPGCKLTPTGLLIEPGLELDDIKQVAATVTRIGTGHSWWLGDLLHYSHHALTNEEFELLLEELSRATGVGTKRLRLLWFTAQTYRRADRFPQLSVDHHLRIISKPRLRRLELLRLAIRHRWSAEQLRRHAFPTQGTYGIMLRVTPVQLNDERMVRELVALTDKYDLARPMVPGYSTKGKGEPIRLNGRSRRRA